MLTAPTFTQPLHKGSAVAIAVLVVLGGAMSFVVSGMQTVVVARMVLGKRISARQQRRGDVDKAVAPAFDASKGAYGSPRIHRDLTDRFIGLADTWSSMRGSAS
jgi:hypothetical protein